MTEATLKMDGVIPSMQIPIQKYAQTVHTLAGTKALSLTLYGAIVGGVTPSIFSVASVMWCPHALLIPQPSGVECTQ